MYGSTVALKHNVFSLVHVVFTSDAKWTLINKMSAIYLAFF